MLLPQTAAGLSADQQLPRFWRGPRSSQQRAYDGPCQQNCSSVEGCLVHPLEQRNRTLPMAFHRSSRNPFLLRARARAQPQEREQPITYRDRVDEVRAVRPSPFGTGWMRNHSPCAQAQRISTALTSSSVVCSAGRSIRMMPSRISRCSASVRSNASSSPRTSAAGTPVVRADDHIVILETGLAAEDAERLAVGRLHPAHDQAPSVSLDSGSRRAAASAILRPSSSRLRRSSGLFASQSATQ